MSDGKPSLAEVDADVAELIQALQALPILHASPGDPDGWGMAVLGVITEASTDAFADSRSNASVLKQFPINHDPQAYFYPASTVKLFAALAAAEKLNQLAAEHATASQADAITLDTPMRLYPVFADQELAETDASNLDGGIITVGHEIRKLFIVSDNRAFNRLYGFVGHADLAERVQRWGMTDTRILHRLSEARTLEQNRSTPRVELLSSETGDQVMRLPERHDPPTVPNNVGMRHLHVGLSRLEGGEIVQGPFDFTQKNFASLPDLQRVLALLCDPDVLGGELGGRALLLDGPTRAFVRGAATELPRESANPRYDPADYPDDYAKFLLPGLLRAAPLEEWSVTNKIGLAYGYVTENARVEHRPTGRVVYLAMTIYRNPNGIVNDGIYDYDATLGMYADVGERIGEWLARE